MSSLKKKKQNSKNNIKTINHSSLDNNLSSDDKYWESTVFGFKCIIIFSFLLLIIFLIMFFILDIR